MRLTAITGEVLEEAVRAQEAEEFDSHAVIFWIARNRPRPYVQDLYLALQDDGDPFVNLHTAIGRRLDRMPSIRGRGKRSSPNVRGEVTSCEVWERVTEPRSSQGLPQDLQRLREALVATARERGFVSYTEAAEILGIQGSRPWRSPRLFQALDAISTFEHRNGRPLLSAVVVHGTDKKPGGGFFKMAKSNGVQGPDESNDTFFRAELERVRDYWAGSAT